MWIQCIQVSKYLVQRINSRPTLRGIGNIYDHFSLGQVLGKGRYGVVRLAECNDTLLQYAVKIINKKKVNHDLLKHELLVLRSIKVHHHLPCHLVALLRRTPRFHSRNLRRRLLDPHRDGDRKSVV